MGIQEVAGYVFIVGGAVIAGRALPPLVRASRSGARLTAIPVGVWSDLLFGLGLLAAGVLDLRFPHGTWLDLIPGVVSGAGLIVPIVHWIVSRKRPRRLDLSSTRIPDLISGDMSGPGPASAPDAGTAGLIERIKNVKFSTTRLKPGYDEEEVDIFLDKLVASLSQDGQLDRLELRDIQFSRTRLRPGYVMPDVNTFLDEIAQAI